MNQKEGSQKKRCREEGKNERKRGRHAFQILNKNILRAQTAKEIAGVLAGDWGKHKTCMGRQES